MVKADNGIVARSVRLEFEKLAEGSNSPLDWYDNDAALTEIFHALSITFPAGETFFIDTVVRYGSRIKEKRPELWKQVQQFFKQEAMHTAIHEQWNARIEREFHHPMSQLEDAVERRLKRVKRFLDHRSQLAVTACLEHFTAGLGKVLLDSPGGTQVQMKSKQPFRSLWIWHALEELEHKSVSFDVYEFLNGGYLRRCLVMLFVTGKFMFVVTKIWWGLIARRKLSRLASVRKYLLFMLWNPGILVRFFPHWLAWFIPGYHPTWFSSHEGSLINRYIKLLKRDSEVTKDSRGKTTFVFRPSFPTFAAIGAFAPAKL